MLKISACVIVKDEEKNIRQWMDGVKDIADEMVVVDTGSRDRTVELAQAGGAAVYHFAWCNDFAAAKNYALDQAHGDWIVFLDADEYFAVQARSKIRGILEEIHGDRRIIGISSPLYNINTDNNNEIISTATQNRIFRNMKKLRYEGRIHEHLVHYAKKTGRYRNADLLIYHTGYSSSLTQEKNERNLKLLLEDIDAEGGEKPRHYAYLSVVYFNLHSYDRAIHYAKLAIQAKTNRKAEYRVKQYWIWFLAEQRRGAADGILKQIIDAALADVTDFPDFLWEDAFLDFQAGDYVQVDRKLTQILQQIQDKNLMSQYESTIYARLPFIYAILGFVRDLQGRVREAASLYQKSLREYPYKENVLASLLDLFSLGKSKELAEILGDIYDRDKDRDFLSKCLQERPWDEVYLYYVRPLEGTYEDLMCRGEYRKAVRQAAKERSHLLDEAVAMLFLSLEEFSGCIDELALLPSAMQECLFRYHGGGRALTAGEADAYRTLWKTVLKHGSSEVLDRFGLLSADLGDADIMETARGLCDKRHWQSALELYQGISADSEAVTSEFWYRVGLCFFHCEEKGTAFECFVKAQEMGAKMPELSCYLVWCRES